MSTDKMVAALLLAEEFLANELANREAGMEETSDYVQEARATLAAVRAALRVEGDYV